MTRTGQCLVWGVILALHGAGPGGASAAAQAANPHAAAGGPKIIVIGLAEDGDSVMTAALKRAKTALAASLRAQGARVTVPALTPGARRKALVKARTTDRGRAASDAVIALSVTPVRRDGTYTSHLMTSVRAVVHATDGGTAVRAFAGRAVKRLPGHCRDACVARLASRMAATEIQALAPQLMARVKRIARFGLRTLTLYGFSKRDVSEFRQYLKAFPGARRLGKTRTRGKAKLVPYRTRLSNRALAAAIAKALGHMKLPAAVTRRGRDFSITRDAAAARAAAPAGQW